MKQIFFNFFQFLLQPGLRFPQVTEELSHPPHRRVAVETGEPVVKVGGDSQRHVGGSVGKPVDYWQLDYQVVSVLLFSFNVFKNISVQVTKKCIKVKNNIKKLLIFHIKLSCSVVKIKQLIIM